MLKESFDSSGISESVQRAFRKAVRKYGQREDVTGVDIGWKLRDDEFQKDNLCIRIHVREKHKPSLLSERGAILPDVDGVPTDVIEAVWAPNQGGTYNINPERIMRQDTVQPGLSVGVRNGESGTLGMVATDTVSGRPCWVLSDHVLYPPDGDELLLQPGPSDGYPDRRFMIGRAGRRHRALGVALALIDSVRPVDERLFGLTEAISGIRPPVIGELLEKGGRTTDVTRARVHGVGVYDQTIAGFTLVTEHGDAEHEISMGGDSGAIWYDEDMNGIGMQNWGEPDGIPDCEWALASHLPAAAMGLGFSL